MNRVAAEPFGRIWDVRPPPRGVGAGPPGRALEDRTREQLYEQAKKEGISGRSRMGKWDLIEALRRSR